MKPFVRGVTVTFKASSFVDHDGASVTPDTVTMYVDYPIANRARAQAEVVLSVSSGVWTGAWESAVSYPGTVYYSMQANGSDEFAIDGEFQIKANQANPDPA